MFGTVEQDSKKMNENQASLPKGEADLTKPLYPSRKLKIEGYFLDGYDENTSFNDEDIILSHSNVKGMGIRKVKTNRGLSPIFENGKIKKYSYHTQKYLLDFKNQVCVLSDEMEMAKRENEESTVNMRNTEVYTRFFLTKYELTYNDENGNEVTKTHDNINKEVLVGINVADRYFTSSASGLASKYMEALMNSELEFNKISIGYRSLTKVEKPSKSKRKEFVELTDETKEIQEMVKSLRWDESSVKEGEESSIPNLIQKWKEETYQKWQDIMPMEYEEFVNKKFNKSSTELVGNNDSDDEDDF